MMRRAIGRVGVSTPRPASVTPARLFSSGYGSSFSTSRPPVTYSSHTGAQQRPPRSGGTDDYRHADMRPSEAAAATRTDAVTRDPTESSTLRPTATTPSGTGGRESSTLPVQRKRSHHYVSLFKRPSKPVRFTHTFVEGEEGGHATPSPRGDGEAQDSLVEDDVTKIYSAEELHSMRHEAGVSEEANEEAAAKRCSAAGTFHDGSAPPTAAEAGGPPPTEDLFASIRSHPFFNDLLRRMENNLARHQKGIKFSGRYSLEVVNDCIRPLLQLTDYPFKLKQLAQLCPSISSAILDGSLADFESFRRLHLYRSMDTDLLLDWSVEDFLRRRYESVHISWEPMSVVCRRYGWTLELISDRDCLLYFSEFLDFVELAELERTADGRPKCVIISDPVGQAERSPIPASRLLIRRKPSAETEPSLTESIRLMGTPALQPPLKGRKSGHLAPGESVSGMFAALEKASEAVDGDERAKLMHAAATVDSLRQATHPAGRTIREFSLGKPSGAPAPSGARGASRTDGEEHSHAPVFDQEQFESLASAYHRTKVEVSLLRRRLLGTDSVDHVAEMQDKLSRSRKELGRLGDRLAQMRELRRTQEVIEEGTLREVQRRERAAEGFAVPLQQPTYPEAPEYPTETDPKNMDAAEDLDDIDISLTDLEETVTTPMYESELPAASERHAKRVEMAGKGQSPHSPSRRDMHQATTPSESDTHAPTRDARRAPATPRRPPPTPVALATEAATELGVTTRTSELQRLSRLHGELSSAAEQVQADIEAVQARRRREEEMAEAEMTRLSARRIEVGEQMSSLASQMAELRRAEECEANERAARQAKLVEEELQRERERRQAELVKQREQARQAQREAERALQRQQEAEQAALATEEELLRQLREVRAQLSSVAEARGRAGGDRDGVPAPVAPSPRVVEAPAVEEASLPERPPRLRVRAEAHATGEAEEEPTGEEPPADATRSAGFMCTPEQYEGLHLAATRLRKEIAALEKQMEQEEDEDDETLMTVLAASRADQEELEECILSVQRHAPWAAAQDARQEAERQREARAVDSDARRVQDGIDEQRFHLHLLEKRLQHATRRGVMAKLEQKMVQARREIGRLRVEQDRLRRAGRNGLATMGVPNSISMADTLAEEAHRPDHEDTTAEAAARDGSPGEEAARATDGRGPRPAEAARAGHRLDALDTAEDGGDEEDGGGRHDDGDGAVEASERRRKEEEEVGLLAREGTRGESVRGAAENAPIDMMDPEAARLRQRLDGLVKDIQHLQDNIELQECTSDYDDEETEVVLVEMRKKLEQLLRLRDDIQKRFRQAPGGTAGLVGSPTLEDGEATRPSVPVVAPRAWGTGSSAEVTQLPSPRVMRPSTTRSTPAMRKSRVMMRRR